MQMCGTWTVGNPQFLFVTWLLAHLSQWMLQSIRKQIPVKLYKQMRQSLHLMLIQIMNRAHQLQCAKLDVLLVKSNHHLAMVGDLYLLR